MLMSSHRSSMFISCSSDGTILFADYRLQGPEFQVGNVLKRIVEHRYSETGKIVMLHTKAGLLEMCRVNSEYFDGFVGIVRNTENNENVEAELEEMNHELEEIFESSHDGIIVADGAGLYIRINDSCERITGTLKSEIIGRTAEECVQAGVFPESVTLKVLKTGQPITFSQTFRSGLQSIITGNPVFDENGKIIRVVINVRDMTEICKLKSKLFESQEKISSYSQILENLAGEQQNTEPLVFRSQKIKAILDSAVKFAKVDAPLLITGESGVGKEVIADLIYRNSLRKKAPFLKINCGAIPETLLESELFGYEGGAFTGAKKDGRAGLLEMANGGTLMLDEIGELSLALQVKLLRVVQQQEFYRVGGKHIIRVDVRIIAVTNSDLQEMVKRKEFRIDLFYRLNVLKIHVPSLRERPEDIIPITNYFLNKYNEKYHVKKRLSGEVYQLFADNSWAGNVRELENLVERLVVICDNEEITSAYLPGEMRKSVTNVNSEDSNYELSFKQAKEMFEREFLRQAIKKHQSSRRTAERLGLDHSTVVKKAAKYGINLMPRWH